MVLTNWTKLGYSDAGVITYDSVIDYDDPAVFYDGYDPSGSSIDTSVPTNWTEFGVAPTGHILYNESSIKYNDPTILYVE